MQTVDGMWHKKEWGRRRDKRIGWLLTGVCVSMRNPTNVTCKWPSETENRTKWRQRNRRQSGIQLESKRNNLNDSKSEWIPHMLRFPDYFSAKCLCNVTATNLDDAFADSEIEFQMSLYLSVASTFSFIWRCRFVQSALKLSQPNDIHSPFTFTSCDALFTSSQNILHFKFSVAMIQIGINVLRKASSRKFDFL